MLRIVHPAFEPVHKWAREYAQQIRARQRLQTELSQAVGDARMVGRVGIDGEEAGKVHDVKDLGVFGGEVGE